MRIALLLSWPLPPIENSVWAGCDYSIWLISSWLGAGMAERTVLLVLLPSFLRLHCFLSVRFLKLALSLIAGSLLLLAAT